MATNVSHPVRATPSMPEVRPAAALRGGFGAPWRYERRRGSNPRERQLEHVLALRRRRARERVLAGDDIGERVELHPQAVPAQLLPRLDERARDVAVLDEAVVLREPRGAREPARGRVTGVGHRDDEIGVDRRLAREDLPMRPRAT